MALKISQWKLGQAHKDFKQICKIFPSKWLRFLVVYNKNIFPISIVNLKINYFEMSNVSINATIVVVCLMPTRVFFLS